MSEYNYIGANLSSVRRKLNDCCSAIAVNPGDITLITVSKTQPASAVNAAIDFGQLDFGENKPQELCLKHEQLSASANSRLIRWHLIGHLQTNKVKLVVPFVYMIHTLDSHKLAQKIQDEAAKAGKQIRCLIQVNTSGEEQKSGIAPEETEELVKSVSQMKNIRISGLMTIAKFIDDYSDESQRDIVRGNFRELKRLFDSLNAALVPNVEMKYLSMGMTSDYDIALEEGSNMLRIGTAIFGERKKIEIN